MCDDYKKELLFRKTLDNAEHFFYYKCKLYEKLKLNSFCVKYNERIENEKN